MSKFNSLYISLIQEFVEYKDLPKVKPYGFWISPDGKFETVPRWSHHDIGEILIDEHYPFHKGKKNEAVNFLISRQWVRVVFEGNVLRAQTKFFSSDPKKLETTIPYETDGLYHKVKITRRANTALRDLAMWYDISENDIVIN